jgi:hypothetical protein
VTFQIGACGAWGRTGTECQIAAGPFGRLQLDAAGSQLADVGQTEVDRPVRKHLDPLRQELREVVVLRAGRVIIGDIRVVGAYRDARSPRAVL